MVGKDSETRKRDLNTKEDEKVKNKFDDEEEVINKGNLSQNVSISLMNCVDRYLRWSIYLAKHTTLNNIITDVSLLDFNVFFFLLV